MPTTIPNDPWGTVRGDSKDANPSSAIVNAFHVNSDVDSSVTAMHHRLGTKRNQASQGDHIHDGENGLKLDQLMSSITVTGARGGNAALASLLTALANEFGLIDATTP